jgi:glycosyltransferase involved in cell wall biosynthesis
MKLLYVIHQFYPEFHSGTEKFLFNLASAAQRDGHFAQIVTYTLLEQQSGFQSWNTLYRRDYVYRSIPVISVRHKTFPDDVHISCRNPDIYNFAVELLKEKSCDLLHIAHPMRLVSFAEAAVDLKIPYIFTLTDFWMMCPKTLLQTSSGSLCAGPEVGRACGELCPELDKDFIRQRLDLNEKILSEAAAVVSPSRFLAAMFKKQFPGLEISIIPHGMDFRYLQTNPRQYFNQDDVVFAYCGTLSPHKGIHLLIQAFLNLNAENGKLKLYGSGSHDKDYFNHLLKIAEKDSRVEFCGVFENNKIGHILSAVDVIVLPSLCYESYSLALHEALACGIPVIASNIGGLAEKVTDSVNGYTFQFGDEKDLTHKMKRILENPEILNSLKQNVSDTIPPTVEEEAYLYNRLYTQVLKDYGR